ncbi:Kiwa anti-phage protein KwaB-like domain-containing protein [Pseudoalteromonas luteoviolacea]|uniref:DUF4868 domain-containing protein n=1 Tax=Pseudoalteromonas luteoviolacea S4054 TaxID=1129367 RepID=A0A0F6ADD3_9GAMM|nr:Kiwa anti-phage protein KwaB-like domain-containing protein [Pseudoalteromonas luteoviolacea]AOT08267.1 hypothetical protein S4054249_10625 [Pseudoalteromonas luteoviolacea]AOT13183.1 hypothetical protein S40542_10600 [Pseudoalteromonas luteoviolacea]AOT18095.1 hypothetical protein S4054_10595 [Pseudoalteromonas luteoviolacea]KKE84200.1 hypothetical protein N479_09890 [Pseudoalteromonas luteoviolacea S4054]KZN76195.1 hypothetical protein N481_07525 [Pseudoalteromonas luteoviolacea S4047-1]
MLQLEDLLEYAEKLENDDNVKVSLMFVTRKLKPGMKASAKVLDKFDFILNKVALSEEISQYFKSVLINQIKTQASKDDIEVKPYTVIGDDLPQVYSYALNNALSFSKVITEQARADNTPTINCLNDIKNDLWAYCIKVKSGDKYTYSFRKVAKGKITTNTPDTLGKKLSAMFDKSEAELQEFDGSVISFDDKIDCLCIDEQFYVFHKSGFEQILGLDEEFTKTAQETVEAIKGFDLVEGLDLVEKELLQKSTIRKTLSSIKQKGNDKSLTKFEITAMNEILQKLEGESFEITEDGKIILSNSKDVKYFVKLLNDYYKQGMTTKKYYTSNAGSIIDPQG